MNLEQPRRQSRRPELLYRELQMSRETYAEDPRLKAITEKVIDYMHATEPEQWTKDQWQLFKAMWQDNKSRMTKPTPTTASMSLEDLKSSLIGAPSTSPP